ncbi:MAG: FG-GAP-like repeat-containing protein, partial [Verrucomicrobia bacterium]|nr:FG-GAP-like repeat-containing protein [Verrucomicrobiota bacterium]
MLQVCSCSGLLLALAVVLFMTGCKRSGDDSFARYSNLGKRSLEDGNAKAAVEAFQQALALHPTLADARFNVALALLQAGQHEQAIQEAQAVLERDRNSAAAWYVIGLANLHQGRFEPAVQALTQAKNIDITVNPVAFQLGLAYEGWGRFEEAINEWQTLAQFEPDHPAVHYRLSQALRRAGKTTEADAELEQHRQLLAKQSGQGGNPGTLEQCVYTRARLPLQVEPPDKTGIKVVFTDATKETLGDATKYRAPLGVIDFAQDGHNHLLVSEGQAGFRLLLNSNGVFRPQGNLRPGAEGSKYTRCLIGDLNNDGVPDALFLGDKGVTLFKFATNGNMTDATKFAGLSRISAVEGALLDLDFRGNLDLVAVNPDGQGARVLRNLGNMYFADCTATSGVPAVIAGARQVLVEDWNNDDIQDVVIGRAGQVPMLLLKQRGGPLVATNAPKDWPASQLIATGDLNNDLKPDLVAVTPAGLEIILANDPRRISLPLGNMEPALLQLMDYDNDGWLDIFVAGRGLKVFRNLGPAGFRDVTAVLGLDKLGREKIMALAAADFDNDGDTDLIVATESGLRFVRNDGGNANLQLKIQLAGRRSNASGLGIRLEIAAGGFRLGRRVQSLPVEIGVGRHAQLDSVNARWFNTSPSYVDIKVDPRVPLQLVEIAAQEGSCPYLYAWDGRRFRFVTDILGAAPLGLPVAEGRYVEADAEEIAWIGNESLCQPRQGQYLLQITEELREVLYLDEARLLVADHPANTEVHPTSKLRPGGPFPKHELITLHQRYTLLKATRSDGEDVTSALAEMDGQVASPPHLRVPQLRGLAEPHAYVLDFGPLDARRPLVRALTGWLRLGGGMANIAASHHPDLPFPFPMLEAETGSGDWQKLDVVVGAPSGKTKTILVDLAGKLPLGTRRLRLGMAYELHWDRMALFEKADPSATRITGLSPVSANLHWRGFSELADLPWFSPLTPVYEKCKPATFFDILPAGWCTRYGPVDELVAARDNALALINGGDELTLAFTASEVPGLAPALVRDFFLDASGWDKDSDFHVKLGTTV